MGAARRRAGGSRRRAGQAVLRRHEAPPEHRVRRHPPPARRAARRADGRRRSAEPRAHLRHARPRSRATGVSLLLTTHHLEEAEARCTRTVIIDHGQGDCRRDDAGAGRSDGRAPPHRHAAADASPPIAAVPPGVEARCRDDPPRRCSARVTDVARELPALLERVSAQRARRRGRRGARPEPAVGVHPPDRKGAAGMIATLLRISWTNLQRDRVAQALDVPAADRVLLDLRDRVRQPGRRVDGAHPRRRRRRGPQRVQPPARRRPAEGEGAARARTTADAEGKGATLDRAGGRAAGPRRRRAGRDRAARGTRRSAVAVRTALGRGRAIQLLADVSDPIAPQMVLRPAAESRDDRGARPADARAGIAPVREIRRRD